MCKIRLFQPDDWPRVWAILEPVFRAGETYPQSTDITESEARAYWIEHATATYVAESDDQVVGSYYLRPNQPTLGGHVANAGYVVAERARGRGLGKALGRHSCAAAREHGFRALQFNLVVATNVASIRAWQAIGFEIVGTLPGAFRHARLGYVDAHVMHKPLTANEGVE